MIIKCINQQLKELREQDAAQQLCEGLCKLIPGSSIKDSNEQLCEMAEKLKSPGVMLFMKMIMMHDDMRLFAKCSDKMGFSVHGLNKDAKLRVIKEFQDKHITDFKAFLNQSHKKIATVQFLCLCGHGLTEETAVELHNNPADYGTKRSPVWAWELCSCEKVDGMNKLPSVMIQDTRKGETVVFSSGLLTPEWVVEKLRGYEDNLRSWNNTVNNTRTLSLSLMHAIFWEVENKNAMTPSLIQ